MREVFKKFNRLAVAALVVLVLLFFPLLHALVVAANFVAHIVVLGLQLVGSCLPRVRLPRKFDRDEAFVSIHVPAHNEPPELLKETLRSLSRLKWENYEVLVIDNNTSDPALWRPIEEFCEQLGPKFRFFHVENLKGFKAGAMNYVRRFMDRRAQFIFVVDADYVVRPNCLRRALSYVTDPKIALVQFPQDYRNISRGNLGIALDFKHFFSGYMNMANLLDCVPSTGTLSLISVAALRAVGGFNTRVVTEDAELGFRLTANGYRCLYVNAVVGQGLMPYDLESLKKQRWRWAFGNAQILKANWRRILFGRELNWRQKVGFVIHMTAWFNFNLIPSLSLILLAAESLFRPINLLQNDTMIIAWFTLLTYMVMRFGTVFYSLRREGHRTGEIWRAYFTHVGLGWIFCSSWLRCLYDHRSPFVRTNKFIQDVMPGALRTTVAELALAAGLLLASAVLTVADFVYTPAFAFVMGLAQLSIYWVWHQAKCTGEVTRELIETETALPEALPEAGEETLAN